ncbi:hypothetical protein BDW71DRAFT_54946 [Aspergillus fruticulosus]
MRKVGWSRRLVSTGQDRKSIMKTVERIQCPMSQEPPLLPLPGLLEGWCFLPRSVVCHSLFFSSSSVYPLLVCFPVCSAVPHDQAFRIGDPRAQISTYLDIKLASEQWFGWTRRATWSEPASALLSIHNSSNIRVLHSSSWDFRSLLWNSVALSALV